MLILNVIRYFYILNLALSLRCLLLTVLLTIMVLLVIAIYISGQLDPYKIKNLDLKSGETTC